MQACATNATTWTASVWLQTQWCASVAGLCTAFSGEYTQMQGRTPQLLLLPYLPSCSCAKSCLLLLMHTCCHCECTGQPAVCIMSAGMTCKLTVLSVEVSWWFAPAPSTSAAAQTQTCKLALQSACHWHALRLCPLTAWQWHGWT